MSETGDSKLARVVTSFPAVVSLALLLANDWYFKAAFGNGLTGKLSDFAGIFLLALLAFAVLPRHKSLVAVGIVLAFAWWKSPLSQPVIDLIQSAGVTRFGRVVDFTDLIALVMVPVAWGVVNRLTADSVQLISLRRIAFLPLCAVSLFSMVATTVTIPTERFDVRQKDHAADLDREKAAAAIKSLAEELGLNCDDCVEPLIRGSYSRRYPTIRLSYYLLNDGTIRVSAGASKGRLRLREGSTIRSRDLEEVVRESLRDAIGEIEFQQDGEPPSDPELRRHPRVEAVSMIFTRIADDFGLQTEEGDTLFARPDKTLSMTYRWHISADTLTVRVWGTSPEEATKLEAAVVDALNTRFSGVHQYTKTEFYFGSATLREPS